MPAIAADKDADDDKAKLPRVGRNMLENEGFDVFREGRFPGWHIHMTDFRARTERNEPSVYFCANCKHEFANVRPWRGVICPKCERYFSGDEAGEMYLDNHDWIDTDRGMRGKAIHFKLNGQVGSIEGVRVLSKLFKVDPDRAYHFSFDVRSKDAIVKAWVEGFRDSRRPFRDEDRELADELAKASESGERLEKIFRKQVNAETPAKWTHFETVVVSPGDRYAFDYLAVNLYAYMPGEAWFDNVSLVPLSDAQTKRIRAMSRKERAELTKSRTY